MSVQLVYPKTVVTCPRCENCQQEKDNVARFIKCVPDDRGIWKSFEVCSECLKTALSLFP